MLPNDVDTKPTSPLHLCGISLYEHCFNCTVSPRTPTITAFLHSHQTPPIVLGAQLLYFKVLLPPPSSSSSSFFPTIHFGLPSVFRKISFRLLSDMQKMLTLIHRSNKMFSNTEEQWAQIGFKHNNLTLKIKSSAYDQQCHNICNVVSMETN